MNYNTILPPFKWFVLQNFPYIEDDFDALTNWQLFCKLGKEMNKIIEKCNLTGEQVENLTNAFNALKAYVDDYFENLDVQDEIDNKLDEMAEQGVLTDIIAQYLQLAGVLAYNTVADLKSAENIADGSFVKTYGYHQYNDGGGAFYKVRQVQNTDVEDDMFIIALHDTNLVAELIIEDKILNVLKVGVKNDNSDDISTKINTLTENYSLFLPAGQYKVENTINLKHSLYGEGFSRDNSNDNGQTILNSTVIEKTINIVGNAEASPQNVERIKIVIDDNTTSTEVIRYNPATQTRCYIKEIGVFNFVGTAINLNATSLSGGWISRGLFIDTISLFARPYTNSIGINCNTNVSDNRFSNIEIMYARVGIVNNATIYIDNIHIWNGGTGSDLDGWWNTTRGIENTGSIQATNLYIDTSMIALSNNNGQIFIDNFTYWIDDSISGSPQYDASIVYGNNFVDRQNVMINNARIYIGDRIKFINGRIKNLRLLYDTLTNLDFPSLHDVDDLEYYLIYTQSTATTRYVPVAILQLRYSSGRGYSEIEVTTDAGQNGKIKCSYDYESHLKINCYYYNKANLYFYKLEDNKIKIYLETNATTMFINTTINAKSHGMFPLNLNTLENNTTKKFIGEEEILNSSTGLTQIPLTQIVD